MTAALVWIALALAALGHGLIWTGVVNRIHACAWPRDVIKVLTLLCGVAFVAIPAVIAGREFNREPAEFNPFAYRDWAAAYLGFCALIGATSLFVKPWIESRRCDRSVLRAWTADCRSVAKTIGRKPLVGAYASLLGSLPGNEVLTLSVDRKRLALPRLPPELEGLTIAHLSDLHMMGRVDREFFAYVASQVNGLRPDVIAITGDIVEHERCWNWLDESLGQLCAPLGVYFILGNHDLFIDVQRTTLILEEAGLICLSGRWLRADWNGAAVTLGGNELPWRRPAPPLADLPARGSEPGQFRLALCHSPDQFGWCRRADVDLALAGHTHGGQVQLPLLGVVASPSLYGSRYACGVFRRGSTVLHVTRGLGGETPLRWRCAPEIALLELTQQSSAAGQIGPFGEVKGFAV